jgi:hypothetical protein
MSFGITIGRMLLCVGWSGSFAALLSCVGVGLIEVA